MLRYEKKFGFVTLQYYILGPLSVPSEYLNTKTVAWPNKFFER